MSKEVEMLLGNAERLYQEALKELEAGRIRKAAENAWGATAKATDALLYARAKFEVVRGLGRTRELYKLAYADKEVEDINLTKEYNERILHLHGNCFYEGICRIPGVDLKKLIVETGKYIENVKKLSLNT
jgi:HEPN domain-containing protein